MALPDLTAAQKAALTPAQLDTYLADIVDLHHPHLDKNSKAAGLTTSLDVTAGTVTVKAGFYEIPADNAWVKSAGIGNRWELPIDVTLTLPARTDSVLTHPFLVLAYNPTTQKTGIWISQMGVPPDPWRSVEFLAWRRGGTARWRVRTLYVLKEQETWPVPGPEAPILSPIPMDKEFRTPYPLDRIALKAFGR